MNFDDRKNVAAELVEDFMTSFSAPRGLDEAARAAQVISIADSLARKMPVTTESIYADNLEIVFAKIRDEHKGYAWPVQSEFVDAMPKSWHGPKTSRPQTFQGDPDDVYLARLQKGLDVPEHFIWRTPASDLVDRYRKSSVVKHMKVFGDDAYQKMQSRYGDVVAPYFADEERLKGR